MEHFLKQMKLIQPDDLDLVNGYVHRSQQELPQDNQYFVIPSLLIYTILYYFYEPEQFDEISKGYGVYLNASQTIATTKGYSSWLSIYGTMLIPPNTGYIYEWKFKILEKRSNDHLLIGIHSFDEGNKLFNNDFTSIYAHGDLKSNYWALCDSGVKYSTKHKFGMDYCNILDDGSITMILDTNKKTISYKYDLQDLGVAFDNIDLYQETYLAMAVGQTGLSIELLSFSVQA